jgi:hypothetical protein
MNKILFDLSDISQKFFLLFEKIPNELQQELSDVNLKKTNLNYQSLERLKCELKIISIPEEFKQLILEYDFGDLTLGSISFGYKENYIDFLIKHNTFFKKDEITKVNFPIWWKKGERPSNYLAIADSDGYIILLDTETGQILAFSRIESYQDAQLICSNFKLFFQAAATIYIRLRTDENKELLVDIPNFIGSVANNNFWNEIML